MFAIRLKLLIKNNVPQRRGYAQKMRLDVSIPLAGWILLYVLCALSCGNFLQRYNACPDVDITSLR